MEFGRWKGMGFLPLPLLLPRAHSPLPLPSPPPPGGFPSVYVISITFGMEYVRLRCGRVSLFDFYIEST